MGTYQYNVLTNQQELVFVQPVIHSIDEIFTCYCIGQSGQLCYHTISGHDVSAHLREIHDIHGPDDKHLRCPWSGCSKEIKKESLTRHVQSVHLNIQYACDTCNQSFSRMYGLRVHKRTCTGPQQ